MAKGKVMCTTCVFVLIVLIFSYEIVSIEGRQLKAAEKNIKCGTKICATIDETTTMVAKMSKYYSTGHSRGRALQREAAEATKPGQTRGGGDLFTVTRGDFRPTTPGHSPGVGHDLGPSSTYMP